VKRAVEEGAEFGGLVRPGVEAQGADEEPVAVDEECQSKLPQKMG
jgi:hypothetical protein